MREEPPTAEGRTGLPPPTVQTRPRKIIAPSGHVDYEPLPLFDRLLQLTEEQLEEELPSPESYGWDSDLINAMAWAHNYDNMTIFLPSHRYGMLPMWFPTTDCEGHELTEVAQVDRFLLFLGHVIRLPEDHRTMDPHILASGLLELHEAYEAGAFEIWDEGHKWPVQGQ